jgi:hypothetical protein
MLAHFGKQTKPGSGSRRVPAMGVAGSMRNAVSLTSPSPVFASAFLSLIDLVPAGG